MAGDALVQENMGSQINKKAYTPSWDFAEGPF